jgi:hypothetical protein
MLDIFGCCLHLWQYCTFCARTEGLNIMKERFHEYGNELTAHKTTTEVFVSKREYDELFWRMGRQQ